MAVLPFYRHGQPGYYALSDLPQRGTVAAIAQSTGWWELDALWKIYPGQFNIVSGIAGHGKSTFLMNVLCNMAKKFGTRSFLYVPENEGFVKEKLRLIWNDDVSFQYFCSDQCYIQSAQPNAYDDAPRTLNWVLDKAVIAVERDHVDLIMIDPWNELERAKERDQLMTDYIGQCLMMLKQFCRCMNATVIVVAHPTKAGVQDGKAPSLADIEGSMNWFNKCDNGLIVHREGLVTKVISAKVREIGAGRRGACWFNVDNDTGIFTPQMEAVTT
jgi:twinkle protein